MTRSLTVLRTLTALVSLVACAPSYQSATRLYGTGVQVFPAGWLSSGHLLATALARSGQPEIVVVSRSGQVVGSITGPSPQTWAGDPHPTADQFLAESYTSGVSDLYVLALDGRVVQRLTTTPWNEWHPAWSPDGASIVYDSDSASRSPRLVVHDARSARRTFPTSAPSAEQGGSWSPDGSMLAFHRLMRDGTTNYDIVVVEVATGKERVLTSGDDDSSAPSWSPDGARIAFSSNRTGTYQLYVACANGEGTPRRVAGPAADSRYPKWSRDGASIAYQVLNDGIWLSPPPAEQGC